jgi:pyruvate formate lyase activating enzyme
METNEGIVFNIQRYSIDDGPGVRTTVFMKGCPLTCLWCSNPESQCMKPEVTYRYTSCKHCLTCVKVCPEGIVTMAEDGIHIDRSKCTLCGECVKNCLPQALQISGKKMTVDEVFKVVKKDADYYEASGGGVTASGGEILAQADFVAALFKKCKEAGYHTNADTTGFGDPKALEKILAYSDLVFYDLKHMDPAKHQEYTGQSNDLILKNLKFVVDKGVPVVIRVPLIPGYNNTDENLHALGKTVAGITKDSVVNILPYHKYGANKYRMIDMTYQLDNVPELTPEELSHAKEIIESYGLKCEISK